jgi:hypothetical protein
MCGGTVSGALATEEVRCLGPTMGTRIEVWSLPWAQWITVIGRRSLQGQMHGCD